jgi:CBS-domain-containing membrane protein
VVGYFSKWQGSHGKDPASVPSLRHSFISLLQAALSITVLSFLDTGVHTEQDWMFLVASFGATAVLLYSSHTSPLAQPRNVLVGHFVSSVAGVTVYKVRW